MKGVGWLREETESKGSNRKEVVVKEEEFLSEVTVLGLCVRNYPK